MRPEEIALIRTKHNSAIVAPAGHGKTEMIVDLVEAVSRKALLVTHTNAGIDALTKRLRKRGVDSKKYSITTIAGFCLRWCTAYPNTGNIRDIPVTSKDYYPMQYKGAREIFQNAWARDVLYRTYGCVIVDEYQDCIVEQHQIFVEINKTVPVVVLGDPLQAIFGWAGRLVSWKDICFERVEIQTFPWRWKNTNPALGQYLTNIRATLLPGLDGQRIRISVLPVKDCVRVVPSSCKYDLSILNYIRDYRTVLFIAKWPAEQSAFCQSTGGIFQNDEPQGLNYLYEIAELLDSGDGLIVAKALMDFLESSTTKINQELGSYKKHVISGDCNFTSLRKHKRFGELLSNVIEDCSIDNILGVLEWVNNAGTFKQYRKELYAELCRALRYSRDNKLTILESAQRIRMMPGLQRKYPGFKMLSSRTVLSKGLEFECVIIDLEKALSVTDYYVAMTRATKEIILICDKKTILLDAPKL